MNRKIFSVLGLFLLTGCSLEITDTHNHSNNDTGEGVAFCGYNFESESPSATTAQLSVIDGQWIDWIPNSCTSAKDTTGKEYCYKSGFQVNAFKSLFGEITFKYKTVSEVMFKQTFEITTPAFNKFLISKELSGSYSGYRLVQLEGGQGFLRCQNFAYRYDGNEKRLYYTRAFSHTGWTTESLPDLNSFLKEHPVPEKMYWIRF